MKIEEADEQNRSWSMWERNVMNACACQNPQESRPVNLRDKW